MTLKVIPRNEWSNHRNVYNPDALSTDVVDCFVIHHEAGPSAKGLDEAGEKARLKAIEDFHVRTRGWDGIAYNYLVFPSGRVYQGRGHSRSAAQGTTIGNSKHIAICLPGNLDKETVTDAQKQAIKDLMTLLMKDYRNINAVRPHGFFHSTDCPGKNGRDLAIALNLWLKSTPDPCCNSIPDVAFPEKMTVELVRYEVDPAGNFARYKEAASGRKFTVWKS